MKPLFRHTWMVAAFSASVLLANPPGERALPIIELCQRIFVATFHDIQIAAKSVTTSRRERRVAVHRSDADHFYEQVGGIVGKGEMHLRDVPDSDTEMFITNTDYLRTVIGTGLKNEELNRARIRIRNYFQVPVGTTAEQISHLPPEKMVYSKIADGEGIYAKLEFKVGRPDPETLEDIEGVVDKPGITMLRSDIDLLLHSPDSFRAHRDDVMARARAVTLTQDGVTENVNDPRDVAEMIVRIGWLHEQGWQSDVLHPQTNVRYRRKAYRLFFPDPARLGKKFEVQITFDEDIRQTYLRSGNVDRYDPEDRVIELKIPVEYASLSDAKLRELGLQDLVEIRAAYEWLIPLPGTERNSGKRTNLRRKSSKKD